MSTVVACPGCATKLSAPDTAAGKQLRCPKCGATVPVPAATAPAPEPLPLPPPDDEDEKPRTKKAKRADGEDQKPRTKKKRRDGGGDGGDDLTRKTSKAKKIGGAGIIIGVVAGGLLLLCLIGVGAWVFVGKGSPLARRAAPPAGWKQYKYDAVGLTAYLPGDPLVTPVPVAGRVGPPGGGTSGALDWSELQGAESVTLYMSAGDGVTVTVIVMRFRDGPPAAARDRIRRAQAGTANRVETRKVRWFGSDAVETSNGNTLSRTGYTDKCIVAAQITRTKPETETGFFDNIDVE